MKKRIGIVFIWFSGLILLLTSIFWLTKPTFSADMFSLLPKSHSQLAYGEQLFFENNADRVVFSFAGEQKNNAHDEFNNWLEQQDITSTFNFPSINALTTTFAPYKYALLSEPYKQQIADKASFEQFYLQQLNQLGSPFVSATLSTDISLSLAGFISENLSQSQIFTIKQNRLTRQYEGVEYAMLFATLPEPNLGINNAISLAAKIKKQINTLSKSYPNTTISYSGVLFHTAENAQQAKYEMSLFGGISLMALMVMVFWVFRALSSILLASFTVLSALMGGAIAMLLVFNSIHLLTLVFAVTLIGIAIDYAFHGMTDLAKAANETAQQASSNGYSKGVKSALLLSFITTALGYSCLLGAPLTLLAQVAVFVIAGLFSAWLFTVLILPFWQQTLRVSASSLLLSKKITRVFLCCNKIKKPLFIALSVVLASLLILKPIAFNDDIRLLNASSERLMANEKKHLTLLDQWRSHIVFIIGDNAQQVLQKQQRLVSNLTASNPHIKHNAINRWLPSIEQQKNNLAVFNQAKKSGVFALSEQLTGQQLSSAPAQFITYNALLNSEFKPLLLAQMHVEPQQAITWMTITNINTQSLSAALLKDDGLLLYNKPQQISALLSDYRAYLLLSLVLAGAISWLLFSWRFSVKIATLQLLSLLLVVVSMLWVCNAIQGSLSLFNMLGALLVVALAIDYLVFYQINKLQPKNILAISLSAASSMWVFGMLSASSTPAIFSFGLTVMVGILAVYILSPLSVLPSQKEG